MSATVTSVRIHPLKSGAITPLDSAMVERSGLRNDRRWMVVDSVGQCVTARSDRALFSITATPLDDDGLRLSTRSGAVAVTGRPSGPAIAVSVHGRVAAPGIPLEPAAQELTRATLGRPDVTLVWCTDPTTRALNPDYSRPGDCTAYADGYPITLASLASLRELNRLGGMALPIDRFRPNLVIDGDLEPFAEESWSRVQIGDVDYRVAKGVARCSMTLIDPLTLTTGTDPIATLAKHRKRAGKTWFCVHLIPDRSGVVHIGDQVSLA